MNPPEPRFALGPALPALTPALALVPTPTFCEESVPGITVRSMRHSPRPRAIALPAFLVATALAVALSSTPRSARADDAPGAPPAHPTSGAGYLDRSGIGEHAFHGFFEGAITGGFLGYALTTRNDSVSASRVAAGSLIGAGVGVALPLWFNADKEVRSGDIVWINAAQNWGLITGFFVPLTFQLGHYSSTPKDSGGFSSDDLRLDFGLSAVVSLAAGGLASYTASDLNFSPGQADMIASGVVWGGLGTGMLLWGLAPNTWSNGSGRLFSAGVALGSTAGAVATWALRDALDVDRGRVVAVDFGAEIGIGAGFLTAWFLDPHFNNHHVVLGSLVGGLAAGGIAGWIVSRSMDDFKKSAPSEPLVATAMVNYNAGHWSPGVPLPRPVVVQGKTGVGVATGVSLLDGRF